MVPEKVSIGGVEVFDEYKKRFNAEYIQGTPLLDGRGIRIHFNDYRINKYKDFEHAVLGKLGVKATDAVTIKNLWDNGRGQERAECCIHWIRAVITSPDTLIYSTKFDVPDGQQRELYLWQGQEAEGRPYYYYLVVVAFFLNDPEQKRWFVTAYPIDNTQYNLNKRNKLIRVVKPELPQLASLTVPVVPETSEQIEQTATVNIKETDATEIAVSRTKKKTRIANATEKGVQ